MARSFWVRDTVFLVVESRINFRTRHIFNPARIYFSTSYFNLNRDNLRTNYRATKNSDIDELPRLHPSYKQGETLEQNFLV